MPSHCWLGFQHKNFGGTQTFSLQSLPLWHSLLNLHGATRVPVSIITLSCHKNALLFSWTWDMPDSGKGGKQDLLSYTWNVLRPHLINSCTTSSSGNLFASPTYHAIILQLYVFVSLSIRLEILSG